jgi:opacity protein-like surface antigen
MGGLKALTLAGAIAMLAAPIVVVPAARAADLLPPAPQQEPPPLRGPVDDSGFYLRGDVGVGINAASGLNSTFGDGSTLASLNQWDGPVNVGDSGVFDFGVGYQFNSWFRADMTLGYFSSASYNSKSFYQFTGPGSNCPVGGGANCGDNYNGTIRGGLFLANGYIDVGTWMGITPYFGGGVGVVVYGVNGLTDVSMSQVNAYGMAPNVNGTNFAWDLTTGLAFHITPNLLLDMSYRYVNMGTMSTGGISCNGGGGCHHETQHFDMASNYLTLGMRWMLPAYEPPVVVAKY